MSGPPLPSLPPPPVALLVAGLLPLLLPPLLLPPLPLPLLLPSPLPLLLLLPLLVLVGAGEQTPELHAPCAQGLPSGCEGVEQTPVLESQAPSPWHSSIASQTTGFAPTQAPAWHVSIWVQPLPSLHTGPVSAAQVPLTVAPAAREQAAHPPTLHAEPQQTPSAQRAPAGVRRCMCTRRVVPVLRTVDHARAAAEAGTRLT